MVQKVRGAASLAPGLCAGAGKPANGRGPLAALARRRGDRLPKLRGVNRGPETDRGAPTRAKERGPSGRPIPAGAGPRPAGQAVSKRRQWGPIGRGPGLTAAWNRRAAFSAREGPKIVKWNSEPAVASRADGRGRVTRGTSHYAR